MYFRETSERSFRENSGEIFMAISELFSRKIVRACEHMSI